MKEALKQKLDWQLTLEEALNQSSQSCQARPHSEQCIADLLSLAQSEIQLTPREVDIATLFLLGRTVQQVADALQLAIFTIEYYTKNIQRRLFCGHEVDQDSAVI